MDALILSCSTGGGHNAAGQAVKEELERRGHTVTMMDPYSLAGNHLDRRVGNSYIRIAQKTPRFFGFIYHLGNWYRKLPIHSPVYQVNQGMCRRMQAFLQAHPFDVILMPHVYPGEILTCMKNKGLPIPKTIFIATDYACIPFTEEIQCDYYITPGPELNWDFIRRGIDPEKLVPAGIPVRAQFRRDISQAEAKRQLGLESGTHYLLLSGGSIGGGKIGKTMGILCRYLKRHPDHHLIVICGNNQDLLEKLQRKYGSRSDLTLLTSTTEMALYMKACDGFLSKPGGLSSTEAAVAGVPLIHLSPIPGCETLNMEFFQKRGMCLAVGSKVRKLPAALDRLSDPQAAARMKENQARHIPCSAASTICDLVESLTPSKEAL